MVPRLPVTQREETPVTPEERLEEVRQQIDDDEMPQLDPSGVVAMNLYYVIALSLNRLANHFDPPQGA